MAFCAFPNQHVCLQSLCRLNWFNNKRQLYLIVSKIEKQQIPSLL